MVESPTTARNVCATAVSASRLKVQKWQVFRGFREFDPDGIPGSRSPNSRKTLKNRHSEIFTHLHTAGCVSRGFEHVAL
jgi:hypothetical protein